MTGQCCHMLYKWPPETNTGLILDNTFFSMKTFIKYVTSFGSTCIALGSFCFCFLNRYKDISEKSHNPVGGLKRKITLFSLLNRCLLRAQSTPRTWSTRRSSCFHVVLCVSSIGETGWKLGYKKTCSGRAPDEE